MSVLLPNIGITECFRAISLLENHFDNIVGTFWVMKGYGFDEIQLPDWWVGIVREQHQAQAILDADNKGCFSGQHDNPLYLGFCIIVTADKDNPANLSYVIQHLRMNSFEGIKLLEILAKHNIPACTEVSCPMEFLRERYDSDDAIPKLLKKINGWSTQIWEDYCSYLMAVDGQDMIEKYWSTTR